MKELNYFELLNVPQSMEMDVIALTQNYFKLQQEHHPDKSAGNAEKSAIINQAFNKIKNRMGRLEYIVELSGYADIKATPELLMEIMELRENPPEDGVKIAERDIEKLFIKATENYAAGKYEAMAQNYIKIKYLKKFIEDAAANT